MTSLKVMWKPLRRVRSLAMRTREVQRVLRTVVVGMDVAAGVADEMLEAVGGMDVAEGVDVDAPPATARVTATVAREGSALPCFRPLPCFRSLPCFRFLPCFPLPSLLPRSSSDGFSVSRRRQLQRLTSE